MMHRSLVFSALTALALGAVACGPDEEECQYERPVAQIELEAGSGSINEEHVISATDSFVSCGRDHTYSWTFLRTPVESQVTDGIWQGNGTPGAAEQSLNFDVPGTYVVQLTIFDGVQTSVEALYVFEIVSDNLPPEADAGPDQASGVGELVTFDGSESYDPELVELEYRWTLEDKPQASRRTNTDIYDADKESASFVPDASGSYVLALEVRDRFVWSRKDYVSLVVVSENEPPVAQTSEITDPTNVLTPCESLDPIALNGSRSWDPEGAPLTYEWGLVSVPDGSTATEDDFTDITSPRPLFTQDIPGEYVFDLRVHDGELWSAWDRYTVEAQDISLNSPPTADAGEDLVAEVEARCYNYLGTWKCGDCPLPKFELNATGSSDPDGDTLNYLWTVSEGDGLTLTYPEGPITEAVPDTIPGQYNVTKRFTWTIDVRAGDCASTATDSIELSMTCRGTAD